MRMQDYEFWFVVGSQFLYGPEVLETVAARASEMADVLKVHCNALLSAPEEIPKPRPRNAPPGRFCPAGRKARGTGCSNPLFYCPIKSVQNKKSSTHKVLLLV